MSRNFAVSMNALFPQISLDWKTEFRRCYPFLDVWSSCENTTNDIQGICCVFHRKISRIPQMARWANKPPLCPSDLWSSSTLSTRMLLLMMMMMMVMMLMMMMTMMIWPSLASSILTFQHRPSLLRTHPTPRIAFFIGQLRFVLSNPRSVPHIHLKWTGSVSYTIYTNEAKRFKRAPIWNLGPEGPQTFTVYLHGPKA